MSEQKETPGTDLVATNGNGSMTQAQAQVVLDRMVEDRDLEGLDRVALEAAAHQEYHRRDGWKERADEYGALKVRAEASLGLLDRRLHPHLGDNARATELPAWNLRGRDVAPSVRVLWRHLASLQTLGVLETAIAAVVEGQDGVSSYAVHHKSFELGLYWASNVPLRRAFLKRARKEGLSQSALAKSLGKPPSNVRHNLGLTIRDATQPQNRCRRDIALEYAQALGVDPAELKPVPSKQRARAKKWRHKRILSHPMKPTGSPWDKAGNLHDATMREIYSLTGQDTKHDELWRHLHAVFDIIAAEKKKQRGSSGKRAKAA